MATKVAALLKIGPLADRVVLRSLESTEQTRGGLFIPDTAKEKPQEGEILAVGPGRYDEGVRIPMDVKVGDRVLFGKYSDRRRAAPHPARERRSRRSDLIDASAPGFVPAVITTAFALHVAQP